MNHFQYFFRSDTLREKLLWWVMLPLVILLVVNIALVYKFGHDSANRRHDRYLKDVSRILLDQLRTTNGQVVFNIHSGALSILNEDKKDRVYYSLSGWLQKYQYGSPDLPVPPQLLSETPVYYQSSYKGQPVRMMAALLPESDVPGGRVFVVVGKTMAVHQERAKEWMWRVLPANLILILLSGLMIWWGVGRGLRPLLQLRDEVIHRSPGDFRPLSKNNVVAEVRPLIGGFNELLKRVGGSMVVQRRFVSDAAHQLRTPIAGLKAQTELALRLNDPEEIRHSLLQMYKATEHAARLVNQLLLLARTEPGTQQQADMMSPLDMVALVRQILEDWVPAALQKGIDLGFEPVSNEVIIKGDAFLLGELLNNLLDNSIRYTQQGGSVTVRVARVDGSVELEVEDNGRGIPESEQSRVFERFYRVLGSGQDGCGLGLAIVREIAQRHHASISLSSGTEGRGTRMTLVFPAG